MKYTKNLNLKKPESNDFYSVDDMNENMEILDEELMSCSRVSTELTRTIIASGWVGEEAPYTNTITVAGATANNNIEVIVPPTATADEISAFVSAMILNGTQANGSITLNCWGTVPEIDLPIIVIVRGD